MLIVAASWLHASVLCLQRLLFRVLAVPIVHHCLCWSGPAADCLSVAHRVQLFVRGLTICPLCAQVFRKPLENESKSEETPVAAKQPGNAAKQNGKPANGDSKPNGTTDSKSS